MNDFFTTVRFKIIAAILAVMVGFMVMSIYTGGTASFFAQIVNIVTVPAQRFSSAVTDGATSFFDRFFNSSQIYEQNVRLQSELNQYRGKLVDYDKIKHENEQLRKILGIKESRQDMELESAAVIARDPTDRFFMFTIDKGTVNGVSYLDPVITEDGLVGYVSEVSLTSAKVMTILDVTISVGAYGSATRDVGIITGTIELASAGMCQMEYLPRDSEIADGDVILTAGGNFFPKDIIIGTVEQVNRGSHGISKVATIRPAAQVRTVKDVFVITSFEGQGGEAAR